MIVLVNQHLLVLVFCVRLEQNRNIKDLEIITKKLLEFRNQRDWEQFHNAIV